MSCHAVIIISDRILRIFPQTKGYSAAEKKWYPPFVCRNIVAGGSKNSTPKISRCWLADYLKRKLGVTRLKSLKVAWNGQLCRRKISERIKFYFNIFHQNSCNLPTLTRSTWGLYLSSTGIFTSIRSYSLFFWCRVLGVVPLAPNHGKSHLHYCWQITFYTDLDSHITSASIQS